MSNAEYAHAAAWTRDTYTRAQTNEALNAFDSHLRVVRHLAALRRVASQPAYTPEDIAERFRRCCDKATQQIGTTP